MEEEVALLVEAGRKMGARNWVPATSGNLSVRRAGTPTRYLISASGGSKSELTTDDFLLFEVGLRRLDDRAAKSSAETAVHDLLYGRYAPGAILHGHPLYATMVAQRFVAEGKVTVTGWELIKAMGFWGEGDVLTLPIVPNHGDIPLLAQAVLDASRPDVGAVLVAGHGVYAWGGRVADAMRHLEAVEYLCQVIWEHLRLDGHWPG